jgi:uncharacterized protein YjiS (DUF1127 family)
MFDTLKSRYARWQRYRRTLAELERLSPRELADLGLSPYDIQRVARDAARR